MEAPKKGLTADFRSVKVINILRLDFDCVASEVRLNVGLDTTLTVLANGCYRWLAKQLHGFETAAPQTTVSQIRGNRWRGRDRAGADRGAFDKRCHNPILREAALDQPGQTISWLQNRPVVFQYP